MNKELLTRLKKLEQASGQVSGHPITIELLENGEYEAYAMIDGQKKVFTDEEWQQNGDAFVKSGKTAALKVDIGEWDG